MNSARSDLAMLLAEYDRALGYTETLVAGLTYDEIHWRPNDESSAIGWHLGHQAAVAHYLVRNLTAAEPSLDPAIDALMDSATDERQRGALPPVERIVEFRRAVAERLRLRIGDIESGNVGVPNQLRIIAAGLVTAVVNHEYQHSQWIGEVRHRDLGHELPPRPAGDHLHEIDGYLVLVPPR